MARASRARSTSPSCRRPSTTFRSADLIAAARAAIRPRTSTRAASGSVRRASQCRPSTSPGHTTVAAALSACTTCHEAAPYLGMIPSTTTSGGDSRPTAFDAKHPTTGDCSGCHTTSPTFASDLTGGSLPPTHIPITPPTYAAQPACATCHTTSGQLHGLFGECHAPGRDALPRLPRPDGQYDLRQRHHGHDRRQSHPDRHARLQRLGLPFDQERERRRLQDRCGEPHQPDPQCRRACDGRGGSQWLSELS